MWSRVLVRDLIDVPLFIAKCRVGISGVRGVEVDAQSSQAMLIPSFDVEQNDEFVILTIRVPYIKVL